MYNRRYLLTYDHHYRYHYLNASVKTS